MHRRRTRWLAVLVVGVTVGMTGCSAGSGGAGGSSSSSAGRASGAGSSSGSAATAKAPGASGGGAAQASTLLTTRALVVTVERTVQVKDLAAAARAASAAARSLGGRVDGEQASTDPDTGAGTYAVTLRVPENRVDALVARVEGEGRLVTGSRSVEDVTQQAQDVQARLASARASVDRVRGLYQRAGSLGDVLLVEKELAARIADLESLERQAAGITDQTSLATVTATFVTRAPGAIAHAGFVPGLAAGWHALVRTAVVTLTVVGAVTPFLLPAAVLGGLVLLVLRYLRRRRPPLASAGE